MICSMTGYGYVSCVCGAHQVNLELKSVNHRYLDVQFKMPEEFRCLENTLREKIGSQVTRGKLECRVQVQKVSGQQEDLQLDNHLVEQLVSLNQSLHRQYKQLGKLRVADILRFPGVLVVHEDDHKDVIEQLPLLLEQVLADFNQSRQREGIKLQQHLLQRLDNMQEIVDTLMKEFPSLLQQHMDKLESRLREAMSGIEDDRIRQEFAIFMQKSDIDEELSRLQTHMTEVRRLVQEQQGAVGKRLDFLMQELNREANTLGSKAISTVCTQASVNLKVLIEQMREQIQNIE